MRASASRRRRSQWQRSGQGQETSKPWLPPWRWSAVKALIRYDASQGVAVGVASKVAEGL
jgi:hypothetical protein